MVRILENSVLARFAEWQEQAKGRPIAAMGAKRETAAFFITNEVIVDEKDRESIERIVGEFGAEEIPSAPIPEQPRQLYGRRRREVDTDAAPRAVRLRFASPPRIDNPERVLDEAFARSEREPGDIVATSEMGARVAALV